MLCGDFDLLRSEIHEKKQKMDAQDGYLIICAHTVMPLMSSNIACTVRYLVLLNIEIH